MSNFFSGNQMLIGKRLREFRLSKEMKAVDLAKICGISQGSLSGLENGKSYPSAETIINLIRHTDIDIEWLLTGEERLISKVQLTNETKGSRKYDILNDAEEWLADEIGKNPKREFWFEVEFEKAFEEFREWKEEKERAAAEAAYAATRKVA